MLWLAMLIHAINFIYWQSDQRNFDHVNQPSDDTVYHAHFSALAGQVYDQMIQCIMFISVHWYDI